MPHCIRYQPKLSETLSEGKDAGLLSYAILAQTINRMIQPCNINSEKITDHSVQ